MSGVTKHIFDQEVRDILSMWDCEIKTIQPLLPKEYSKSDIIALLKEFYPYEWRSVEVKYTYYQTKDRYIKRTYGKNRYDMKAPEVLLMNASRYKEILSDEYRHIHCDNYTEEGRILARENLWQKRKPKIERVNQKIEKALSKTQQVTPSFIDQLIGLYERKNTSQKDRRYILLELKKYYSDKIIRAENQNGKNIFCDWINDVDYLKRHLLCEATLKVLEKRMEQSKAMIFVVSENSRNSVWCKYELNYFTELGKPIYCISKEAIDEKNFHLNKMSDTWFLDSDYKRLALIEGESINV